MNVFLLFIEVISFYYNLSCDIKHNTVNSVYSGQSRGITKVAFVGRWPLFGNISTQLMLFSMLQPLLKLSDTRHDRQKYHCPSHESGLKVLHKHILWYSASTFTSPKSSLSQPCSVQPQTRHSHNKMSINSNKCRLALYQQIHQNIVQESTDYTSYKLCFK